MYYPWLLKTNKIKNGTYAPRATSHSTWDHMSTIYRFSDEEGQMRCNELHSCCLLTVARKLSVGNGVTGTKVAARCRLNASIPWGPSEEASVSGPSLMSQGGAYWQFLALRHRLACKMWHMPRQPRQCVKDYVGFSSHMLYIAGVLRDVGQVFIQGAFPLGGRFLPCFSQAKSSFPALPF
jgi:hypothetical protein